MFRFSENALCFQGIDTSAVATVLKSEHWNLQSQKTFIFSSMVLLSYSGGSLEGEVTR